VEAGYRRTPFGRVISLIAGNPVMPVVVIALVIAFVVGVFTVYGQNNRGVEFFVESEPEQAIVYVRARGNLSLAEKNDLVAQAEEIILDTPGVQSAFAFAGAGGLNSMAGIDRTAGRRRTGPDRARAVGGPGGLCEHPRRRDGGRPRRQPDPRATRTAAFGPARHPDRDPEPLHGPRRPPNRCTCGLKADSWEDLVAATEIVRARYEATPALTGIEDTRPLPGIDWQIDVDVERAGRFGADVATVGAMVQLVTRGVLLDTMRVESSDEEIEIRVRLPEGRSRPVDTRHAQGAHARRPGAPCRTSSPSCLSRSSPKSIGSTRCASST
jgi:multidrug efflux pump